MGWKAAAGLLLLAACGGGPTGGSEPAPVVTMEPPAVTGAPSLPPTSVAPTPEGLIPVCDDIAWFTGPEELYLDHPVYVGNEMPINEVISYASTMEGFVEAWIDRVHNGWVNVGFTDVDLAAAQAELDDVFGGLGVVAVDLPHSHAELEEIRVRVQGVLPEGMDASNTHLLHGRVEVWISVLDPGRIRALAEAVGDEPVCVVGVPPEEAVLPGPQADAGDGWSYLGAFDDTVGALSVIGDVAGYIDLWASFDAGNPPPVNFETSVVLALEIGYSGSCRVTRLDGVEFSESAVRLEINTVTDDLMCTSDYNARTYLVALDRDRLPAPPFTIGSIDLPSGGQVIDDLREPGSTPTELEPAPTPEPVVGLPTIVETGFPTTALLDLSCGIEWVGELNRVSWHTDTPLPGIWLEEAGNGQVIEVTVLVTEGPEPTLTLSAAGHDVVYTPSPPNPSPCLDDRP